VNDVCARNIGASAARCFIPKGTAHGGGKELLMADLATKTCVPCRGGVPPLKGEELAKLGRELSSWTIVNEHHIARSFKFPDFREALAFVDKVGALAEEQGHHPDIFLAWGKVEITIWTHKIDGLTESDFILGAKIDRLYSGAEKAE
jgi:4a-hydroxytetrahydrobiopterin dehydratase